MAHNRKCKITVIKRIFHEDLAKEYAPKTVTGPCMQFSDGQEFILDQNSMSGFWHLMGGTFCSEAWASISHYVDTILQGGTFVTDSGENMIIAGCPHGIHPVIFKIEEVTES